jgi:hypothetical protein
MKAVLSLAAVTPSIERVECATMARRFAMPWREEKFSGGQLKECPG